MTQLNNKRNGYMDGWVDVCAPSLHVFFAVVSLIEMILVTFQLPPLTLKEGGVKCGNRNERTC